MTPDQFKPIVRHRLAKFLHGRAPATGITVWQEMEADALGIGHAAFRHWYYGKKPDEEGEGAESPLPSLAQWAALKYRYEGIERAVFDGILPTPQERTNERLNAVASSLRDLADDIESGLVTQPVPLRGKIS